MHDGNMNGYFILGLVWLPPLLWRILFPPPGIEWLFHSRPCVATHYFEEFCYLLQALNGYFILGLVWLCMWAMIVHAYNLEHAQAVIRC